MTVNVVAIILIAAALALFLRVWTPWGERASGNIVSRQSLSLLGRLRMHGPAALALWLISLVLLIAGRIGPLTALIVTALLLLLLSRASTAKTVRARA